MSHLIDELTLVKGHTLSFSGQPYFGDLVRAFRSTGKVALIVGAGASIDSGLPTWGQLLEAMARLIKDAEIAEIASADASDQLRKAENIQTLVLQTTGETKKGILRKALLPDHLDPKPGNLVWSIARLVATEPRRFTVLTTNFDSMLEGALAEQVDAPVEGVSLGEYLDDPRGSEEVFRVVHLHGRVSKNDNPPPLLPLVLTESEFHRHGPMVKRAVRQAIRDADSVVFAGVSLTDPNVVGPLWDIANPDGLSEGERQQAEIDGATPKYVLSVVDSPGGGQQVEFPVAAKIARFKSLYLEEKLGARPILLKSYSQLVQAFNEFGLCVAEPVTYVLRPKSGASTRYGTRFTRALSDAYRSIDAPRASDIPRDGSALSDRLNDILVGRRGIVAEIEKLLRERASVSGLDGERFGLFLWLRRRGHGSLPAPYEVHMVGCSTYSHRDSWSLERPDEISFNSSYSASRCLFVGGSQLKNLDLKREKPPTWRGIMARPLILHGYTSDASAGPKESDMYDRLTLGSITLNSTRSVVKEEGLSGPMSALTTLNEFGAIAELGEFINSSITKLLFEATK